MSICLSKFDTDSDFPCSNIQRCEWPWPVITVVKKCYVLLWDCWSILQCWQYCMCFWVIVVNVGLLYMWHSIEILKFDNCLSWYEMVAMLEWFSPRSNMLILFTHMYDVTCNWLVKHLFVESEMTIFGTK